MRSQAKDGRSPVYARGSGTFYFCYTFAVATAIILSYKLKCFPTRNKAETLALLSGLFRRLHSVATQVIAAMEQRHLPCCKGTGEFAGRATRRAYTDYQRSWKAARKTGKPFKAPTLRAELIDAAHVQGPRQAKSFDLWVMIQGVGKLYIPARKHRAINRALASPGAALCEQGEVFRKNGKWYVRVGVQVPVPDEPPVKEWIGIDVGARASVTRSDGYVGPDLRPILKRQRDRRALDQKQGRDPSYDISPQRQALAREARKALSVAERSRRGLALENPDHLPRWKPWSARFFAQRILLLSAVAGVPVRLCPPPYTSLTCSRCGSRDTFRHKTQFRCLACRFTANADANASRNIRHRVSRASYESHQGSLSLVPLGGGADG
jgi:transposase